MSGAALPLLAVASVVLATIGIGVFGLRLARTTSDFLVASRSVSPLWNASAIGGEYLSAASFLGVAGLVMVYGADALWYPVGFVAGYFVLLLFVAAPLRRSGAYTVPDFAEVRLGSPRLRRLCASAVSRSGCSTSCRSCTAPASRCGRRPARPCRPARCWSRSSSR
jgi:Na+(H+)/acetate symporter ActP